MESIESVIFTPSITIYHSKAECLAQRFLIYVVNPNLSQSVTDARPVRGSRVGYHSVMLSLAIACKCLNHPAFWLFAL